LYYPELEKASRRPFSTGFYFGKPGASEQMYEDYESKEHTFLAIVKSYDSNRHMAVLEQRNKFTVGDIIEFLPAVGENFKQRIEVMYDENMNPITEAPHPRQTVILPVKNYVSSLDLVRKEI
jgi:putative protease